VSATSTLAAHDEAAELPVDFELSDEQKMVRAALRAFLDARYDSTTRRSIAETEAGWRPEFWRALAGDLGLLGIGFDDGVGGSGGGAVEHAVVMECFGEALVVEPYLPSIVIAGSFLRRSVAPWVTDLSSRIVAGEAIVAFANAEPQTRANPADVTATAERRGNGYVLRGRKTIVAGAPWATHLLVPARTAGRQRDERGISLFVVARDQAGLVRHDYATIDGGRAADLMFDNASLEAEALVFPEGEAYPHILRAWDEAAAALCAEALGIMQRLLRETVAYARERRQFGRALADFQVLQHRMADMYGAVEQSIGMVSLAAAAVRDDGPGRAAAVSAAKAFIGRAFRFVSQSAVQLHGGMGVTEELDIGHLFRRATVIEHQYGSTADHVSRYARLTYRGTA
jgi:alkylation response protein AidB-like acyl-CoA dehydrogenase